MSSLSVSLYRFSASSTLSAPDLYADGRTAEAGLSLKSPKRLRQGRLPGAAWPRHNRHLSREVNYDVAERFVAPDP